MKRLFQKVFNGTFHLNLALGLFTKLLSRLETVINLHEAEHAALTSRSCDVLKELMQARTIRGNLLKLLGTDPTEEQTA